MRENEGGQKVVQSGDGKRASVLILERSGLARTRGWRVWRESKRERESPRDLMGRQPGDPIEKAQGIAA